MSNDSPRDPTTSPNVRQLKVSTFFCWLSKLQCRKGSYYIALDKKIARGLNLHRGDKIKSSLSQDKNNKPIILVEFEKGEVF